MYVCCQAVQAEEPAHFEEMPWKFIERIPIREKIILAFILEYLEQQPQHGIDPAHRARRDAHVPLARRRVLLGHDVRARRGVAHGRQKRVERRTLHPSRCKTPF